MLDIWLTSLAKSLSNDQSLSPDLLSDIENFKELGADKLSSPSSIRNVDVAASISPKTSPIKTDLLKPLPSLIEARSSSPAANGVSLKSLNCSESSLSPPEINPNVIESNSMFPKSPHLSKDFSPTGDRLRHSIRARRQERLAKQRSMCTFGNFMTQHSTCSSDGGSETSAPNLDESDELAINSPRLFGRVDELKSNDRRKRSKPYGEKGFIINVNDGMLTINDVKDLNQCCSDDFDSSCDTSLNYIDCNLNNSGSDNGMSATNASLKSILSDKNDDTNPTEQRMNENDDEIAAKKKISLDEMRVEVNKCKSKLAALNLSDGRSNATETVAKSDDKVSLRDLSSTKSNRETNNEKSNKKSVKTEVAQVHKKPSTKRNGNASKVTNKCNNKNATNNVSMTSSRKPIDIESKNGEKPTKPNEKLNNKVNNRLHGNETTNDSKEILSRKPPTPTTATNSHKKRENSKATKAKASEKMATSSPRKLI